MSESVLDAARRLTAGPEFVPAARLIDALGPLVADAEASRANARLARAGRGGNATTTAARRRAGRERVVRDRLHRLVHDGELEAAGEGADRVYRQRAESVTEKPKPGREFVPLEQLVLDPRLQMRELGPNGETYHEATVAAYCEAEERGDKFPPLEVVDDGRRKYLLAGFNRVEMYRRRGVNTVEAWSYPGTFEDARFWALSENSRHGKPRTPADCRRAFDTLINDPKLREQVVAAAKKPGAGGIQRLLARACGLSAGAVGKYLADAGWRAVRRKGDQEETRLERIDPAADPAHKERAETARRATAPPAARLIDPAVPEADVEEGEVAAAEPDDGGEAEAADDDAEEPLFTVPPPPPHPALAGGARPGQFVAARGMADQLLRDLRSVRTTLEQYCAGRGGAYLRRVTVGGEPLVRQQRDPSARPGVVRPDVWRSALLELLIAAVRRTRVARECAGCGGEGCRACTQTGFIPEVAAGGKVEGPELAFGDPWAMPDEPAGEG